MAPALAATVVVPTFDHGPTLYRSVRSALAQTVADLEVFVVGDGVPDATRSVMADLVREDPRVRFFDHPKGPRHGEVHRHAALAEARGRIVCYLSDDDLYLPDHVAAMGRLLDGADFAHAFPVALWPDGTPETFAVDVALPYYRTGRRAAIPLSCGAHTLALYRRLRHGWRTTPAGVPTDRYMWQQVLDTGCRAVSGTGVTVLTFPSPLRVGQSAEQRGAELDAYGPRLADAAWRARFTADVLAAVAHERASVLASVYGSPTMRLHDAVVAVPGAAGAIRAARRLGAALRAR